MRAISLQPHIEDDAEINQEALVKAPTPLLQKWHSNDIFKAIQAVDLDPEQFDLDDSGAEVRVKHQQSGSLFIISGGPGHYVGRYVFGNNIEWPYEVYSWDALIPHVRHWLQFLKLDLDTPDLWAELQRETKLLGADFSEVTENTSFTAGEQEEIAARLQELARHIGQTYSLSVAQMQALDEKINYLIDASRRLGRKDWLNTFIGVIFGFVLTAALAPEFARAIFLTGLRAIGLLYPELPID